MKLTRLIFADIYRDVLPELTGSKEERVLLGLLRDFMESKTLEAAAATARQENCATNRLKELVHYIEHRERCFPFDLAGRRFS
jgi:hypothetical protein